jgi:hypothetical protein
MYGESALKSAQKPSIVSKSTLFCDVMFHKLLPGSDNGVNQIKSDQFGPS